MGDELLDLEANRQQIGFQIGQLDEDGLYSLDPRAGKIFIQSVENDFDDKKGINQIEANQEMQRCQNLF